MTDKLDFTELEMQVHIHNKFNSGSQVLVPNVFFFNDNESDMARILKTGYAFEYEMKRSMADFKADRKKKRNVRLANGEFEPEPYSYYGEGHTHPPLRQFYYVAPKGVIPVEQIPEYAGLIEMRSLYGSTITKKAPVLSKQKCDDRHIEHLREVCYYRMWSALYSLRTLRRTNINLVATAKELRRQLPKPPQPRQDHPDQLDMFNTEETPCKSSKH